MALPLLGALHLSPWPVGLGPHLRLPAAALAFSLPLTGISLCCLLFLSFLSCMDCVLLRDLFSIILASDQLYYRLPVDKDLVLYFL